MQSAKEKREWWIDILKGAGMAFNPLPAPRRKTFIESDVEAFYSDRAALADDKKQTCIFMPR